MQLPRPKAKDARAPTAAATICKLCDIYTQNGLEEKWRELADVYDQRRNNDNMKEILHLSAPSQRLNDLTGWHLERMAAGEFGSEKGQSANDVTMIKKDCRKIKQMVNKILANGAKHRAKRNELTAAMIKQRDALMVELDAAKEFLGQVHLTAGTNPTALELSVPAPVEQRLLATVKAPESLPDVDLSDVPPI